MSGQYATPVFHCEQCAALAKDCLHDNHLVSGDGGQTWFCQGCGEPMDVQPKEIS